MLRAVLGIQRITRDDVTTEIAIGQRRGRGGDLIFLVGHLGWGEDNARRRKIGGHELDALRLARRNGAAERLAINGEDARPTRRRGGLGWGEQQRDRVAQGGRVKGVVHDPAPGGQMGHVGVREVKEVGKLRATEACPLRNCADGGDARALSQDDNGEQDGYE